MYRIEEADRYRVGDLQCGPLVVIFPVGGRGKSTRTFGIVATGCGNECRRSVRLRGGHAGTSFNSEGQDFFGTRVVSSYLDRGVLERVKESSEFSYPVYVVYPQSSSRSGLQAAMKILRRPVKEDADWSQRWDFLI